MTIEDGSLVKTKKYPQITYKLLTISDNCAILRGKNGLEIIPLKDIEVYKPEKINDI